MSVALRHSRRSERVSATEVQLHLAEQQVSQASERFKAGIDDNRDIIAASLLLNSARDLVVDALTTCHVARVGPASAQGVTTSL